MHKPSINGPPKVERCHSRSSNFQQHKTNLATKNKTKKRQMKSIPYQNSQPESLPTQKWDFFCCSSFDTVYVCMYVCNRECLCLCRRSDSTKWGQACSPNLKLHHHDEDEDTEHPSSLLLLVRENAPPASRNLWSRLF
jgi:hypothetical protein